MAFTPIETQEQFDTIIADRLERAERKVRGEYADYDETKRKIAEYEASQDTAKKEREEERETLAAQIAAANEKLKGYEVESLKGQVIADVEIPYEFRDTAKTLLKGETKEELTTSANSIKKLLEAKNGGKLPKKDAELGDNTGDKSPFSKMAKDLTGGK